MRQCQFKVNSAKWSCLMQVCGATFTTNGSLKRHMCTHTNARPFMCPYCQKTFKTSVSCKKHMKIHRGELVSRISFSVGLGTNVEILLRIR